MATPPVSPNPLLESAEPAGFVARMNANLAFGPAISAAEMRDAHDIVEEHAWVPPTTRAYRYHGRSPTAEQPWFFDPAAARVTAYPEGDAVDVPPAAGRVALAAFVLQGDAQFWDERADADGGFVGAEVAVAAAGDLRADHRLLCRILCAHLLGRPPVDAPDAAERERRAALVARLAAARAAEEAAYAAEVEARRRRTTEVWVRVVAPGRGERGTSFVVVGTLSDMEQRHYEETGPEDDALFVPNLVGLRTADQLPRGITNEQLLRLVRIREDLEHEYDAPYGEDEAVVRRLKAEEARILRTLEGAFRAHRALLAAAVAHAPAVVSGDVRAARIRGRRRHALEAFGRVN